MIISRGSNVIECPYTYPIVVTGKLNPLIRSDVQPSRQIAGVAFDPSEFVELSRLFLCKLRFWLVNLDSDGVRMRRMTILVLDSLDFNLDEPIDR
jgi:hypothetical protein